MGMVTHVLINNDAFHEIKNDPEGFVQSIQKQMNGGGVGQLRAGRTSVGWCAQAHHSSYSVAYANRHTVLVPADEVARAQAIR